MSGTTIDIDPLVDPFGNYYFSLEIDETEIAQFLECSGLKTAAAVFEIEEGGLNTHTHKRPGYSKWENIVLKRAVSKSAAFAVWRDDYLSSTDNWAERGSTSGAIVVRDNAGNELRRYTFNSCWPVSWEGPSFSGSGSDLAVETLEIAHDGILVEDSPRPAAPTPGGGRPGAGGGGGGGDTEDDEAPQFVADIGFDLTQSESQGLEELVVEDHIDMMGALRVTINEQGFDWSAINMGDGVSCGFGGSSDKTFGGYITAFRHFSVEAGMEFFQIIALDPKIKLAASRHTRVFEEMTDSDIVSAVLGEAGVESGTVDSTSATFKYVLQRNESDLRFLMRLAARNGYVLQGNFEGKVDFKKPQYSGGGLELEREKLKAFDYTVSSQNVPTEVTCYGWDYVAKEKVEGTASSVDTIGGGSDAVSETGMIWDEPSWITDVWVDDQGVAQAMAEAHLNRMARQFVQGRAVIEGDGQIRAGVKVKFKGFATGFNPEVVVVGSKHVVAHGEYTTEFWFEGNTKPE